MHHARPHAWSADEVVRLHNAADRIEVATARRGVEEQQAIINGEIAHRLKNTLAMVQAIAAMTLRKDLPPEKMQRLDERLQALAQTHDLLHTGRWQATELHALAMGVLENIGLSDRCRLSGPSIRLGARAAMSASLLLHEMATNAAKYGAPSVSGSSVEIVWHAEAVGDRCELVPRWTEEGGPSILLPSRKGFGSRLVSLGLIGRGVPKYATPSPGCRPASGPTWKRSSKHVGDHTTASCGPDHRSCYRGRTLAAAAPHRDGRGGWLQRCRDD
ncbi:sensor histidine kinase [Rhizosaccharibacter radicis]|uniref:histidine kinase n=1 Tax=Rhizosaccharibacter radicis TaxID=2782605 RepID=A0ABT1VZ93_9PROT|nr:sensor histidine kinase [Acetobacteraceae bacterium KSS12]